MPSEWNMFVKKIYHEGKAKNSNYEFEQALKDASKRKSEMGSVSVKNHKKSSKKGRSRSASMSGGLSSVTTAKPPSGPSIPSRGGRRTRKRHSRRHRR